MPYRVRLTGDMRAATLPVMPVDLAGRLDKDSFSFERADVELYGGHTTASGNITWAPQETWSVSGRATDIDPSNFRADLPGSLNFDYTASGRGFDTKGNLTAAFSDLSGKLRGAAASGAGTIAHAGRTWSFSNLKVALGSTSLALDGQVDERMDLRFALSAQDLSLLAPAAAGS